MGSFKGLGRRVFGYRFMCIVFLKKALAYASIFVLLVSSATPAMAASAYPGYQLNINTANTAPVQDFSWGVLAMNTDKGVYTVGDTAHFEFGVLDEKGEMVCDAELELAIYNKDIEHTTILRTTSGNIKVNPDCQIKAKNPKPDFEAEFLVKDAGIHHL